MLPEDSAEPLIHALTHAAARLQAKSAPNTPIDADDLTKRAESLVATLDSTGRQRLLARLKIESAITGKDMRRELRENGGETAHFVSVVNEETRTLIDRLVSHAPESVVAETRASIESVTGDETILSATPEELYEQLLGVTFDRAKMATGKTNAKKWYDLVAPTFQHGKGVDLVRGVGCIPQQLYDAKKFAENVHFPELALLHGKLKQAENDEGGIGRARMLQARAHLLKQLFLKGMASEAGGKVTLDAHALWIRLEQRKKDEVTYDLNAHLPYEYATDDLLDCMLSDGWITENDQTECRLRRAEELGDVLTEREAEQRKIDALREMLSKKDEQLSTFWSGTLFTRRLDDVKPGDPIPHFPISIVRQDLRAHEDPAYCYVHALELAERIQQKASNEQRNPGYKGYENYDLSEAARKSYEQRKGLLHDPRNYDAPRIVGEVLEAYAERGTGKSPFRLFRGEIREKGADAQAHSFIDIVTSNGSVQHVLLDPAKQLSPMQREIFDSLPVLNKQQYELFETLAYTYNHYKIVAENLREMLGPRGFDMGDDFWRPYVSELLQDANAFIMMETPDRFAEAMALQTSFINQSPYSIPFGIHDILNDALKRFGEKLFMGDIHESIKKYNVDIRRHEIQFDEHFLDDFPERFRSRPDTYNKELMQELQDAEHTIITVDAGDRDIPYAMEAKAIRALRLLPDRPLIAVIGGCRYLPVSGSTRNATDMMCENIVEIGHRLKANIAPPATQSGIGVTLGRAAAVYGQRTTDLPPTERARFFTVAPGGEAYYPGNDFLAKESEKEASAYAIAPFDAIVTPFQAGWGWKGERKKNAPYFRHVEYAEAIYNRISSGQPRVTVVGNGGLFTIVEAIAALKNRSSILLVQETGRFADLAIALQREREELDGLSPDAWEGAVLSLITNAMPDHSKDSLLSAFGRNAKAESVEEQLYRDSLREYFALARTGDIRITNVASVGTDIEKTVDAWKEKNKR